MSVCYQTGRVDETDRLHRVDEYISYRYSIYWGKVEEYWREITPYDEYRSDKNIYKYKYEKYEDKV